MIHLNRYLDLEKIYDYRYQKLVNQFEMNFSRLTKEMINDYSMNDDCSSIYLRYRNYLTSKQCGMFKYLDTNFSKDLEYEIGLLLKINDQDEFIFIEKDKE